MTQTAPPGAPARAACRAGVLLAALLAGLALGPAALRAEGPPLTLEVFTRPGCPRCEQAKGFLAKLHKSHPALHVVLHDIDAEPAARERLQQLGRAERVAALGVPAFYLRGRLLVGFVSEETTGARLRALLDDGGAAPVEGAPAACAPDGPPCPGARAPAGDIVDAPLVGRLSARRLGLPLFTIVLGLLDGFNPCAMWVLLFLLSLLINLKDRRRLLLVGGVFVLTSGLVYFAFMAAWLNAFLLIGLSRAVQIILGAIALAAGVVNVKDFFAFRRGISLSIPKSAKPGIYQRARRILRAPTVGAALGGAVVLAILVNIVELLCTAGLPAVYTQLLALRRLPWWAYYGYLALYNVAYIFDDAIMLSIAVVTLERRKLTERGGRWLKLVSGLVMLGLGALLLLRPRWLVR